MHAMHGQRLGMGSWYLGQGRRLLSTEMDALHTGLELGMTVIDTAEMYGEGQSEHLIGHTLRCWLRLGDARGHQPFVVSKVLPEHADHAGVIRACERSLRRLGLACLDLYLLHWRGDVPLAETVAAFEALRQQGKIKHWGVSNFDVGDMEGLWAVPNGNRCAVNQVLYNASSRGIEFDLLPWCAARGVRVMGYCPLGHGELLDAPVLGAVAGKHGVSSTAVALAWAMRSGHVVPISESGSVAHVQANAQALGLRLDRDDLAAIDAVWPAPTRKHPLDVL